MGKLTHGKMIHTGYFTIIKEGTYEHNGSKHEVIIKEISHQYEFGENELRMIQIIQLIDPQAKMHMPLYWSFPSQECQVLVFEKAEMDLTEYYDSIREKSYDILMRKLSYHMYQIIKMLIQFHKHGIVHCDLKPENIVCRGKNALAFIDFGCTIIANREEKYHVNTNKLHLFDKKQISTPGYQHPSVYKKNRYNLFAQDIWSVMMTAASLATNCLFVSKKNPDIPDVLWQAAFWNGSWSEQILAFKPHLQSAHWFLFVNFINHLVTFSKTDFPCASQELLQDKFLLIWRKCK